MNIYRCTLTPDSNLHKSHKQPKPFKQADVTRAVKGATRAGLHIGSVRICADGTIEIKTIGPGMASPEDDAATAFDKWQAANVH